MVKEIVLVSGISIIGETQEGEEVVEVKYPFYIFLNNMNIAFIPVSKTAKVENVRVKKDFIIAEAVPELEVIKKYYELAEIVYKKSNVSET